jgi:hypothetical protein
MTRILFVYTLLAQAGPSPGGGESASRITQDGAAAAEAITASMDKLWNDVLGNSGGLYAAICKLGLLFAVGALLLWVVQWAKAMADDAVANPISEVIWLVLVVALLANNGVLLSQCSLQLRGIINTTNQTILQATSSSVSLQEAYRQITTEVGAEDAARGLLDQCASMADPQQQQACVDNAKQQAQQISGSLEKPPSNRFQAFLDKFNVGQIFQTNVFQLAVRGWLIAFSIAFQWMVEISMLLTALLGPLAVGGSLLPVGQKAIFAWITGFLSVGMVKLSFNIISGLVAVMVLNAGESDPMIFAFATGLISPILALVLSAGGGMAIFNSLSSVASFGLGKLIPIGFR